MFDPAISVQAELKDLSKEQQAEAVMQSGNKMLDSAPWPVGGWASLDKNLVLPAIAKGTRLKGRVTYEFVLDSQGTVKKVVVVGGLSAAVDAAVEKAIYATKFHPAVKNGRAVNARLRHSIEINMQG